MVDLSTTYMGLKLKNPVIVGSSSLTQSLQGLRDAEKAGAGAIVLKSLFEEQVRAEIGDVDEIGPSAHPEEYNYLISELEMQYGARQYIELIRQAKKEIAIPIIASINCITSKWWNTYAKQIEDAGVDALELNISLMPKDPYQTSLEIEQVYYDIVQAAREAVSLPIAVKIGPYFTGMSMVTREICARGADALVLFNRFYQFDIDIEKMEIKGANWFSHPNEMNLPLRWISILAGRISCDLSATTGIHDAEGLIKQLLAGATTVQVVSTLFLNTF
ncbi:MAG: dihydroorotate dehydrogenase-like protein, partial [Calditrichaeota bacterium]|nr:dihydroorotate dehydrogenase-like protein [Calditrichota bacterium]